MVVTGGAQLIHWGAATADAAVSAPVPEDGTRTGATWRTCAEAMA